ncbi:MAG: 50S ribosomal protein L3 [Candidatus Dadabacteria bacterium]|nr:50S ribosomal protein L3 [Candidatus Dadabacteria bacterium]TDI89639.1 MAG: 50S ribosomal protein L3 [Candidatus Dadabacteria bacterium]TDI99668.1 MAG: 50S ribosomal protein L3 [Candidatus Dadabacteria bacterium]
MLIIMINGLIGKKIGMTEIFLDDGTVVVSTVIEAGPCFVVQKKTADKDGYEAVQIGFEGVKPQRVSKPLLGHFKKAGVPPLRHIIEFDPEGEDYNLGDTIDAGIFKEGDIVDVVGNSKGKGFSGTMKRHNFRGQPASHGGMAHRRPGGIGQASYPGKVWKGMKMPGQMGNERVTVQGISVVRVDAGKNVLIVKGSVPGPNGGTLIIKRTTKGRIESAAA